MAAIYFDPELTGEELGRSTQGELAVCTASSAGIDRCHRHYLLKLANLRLTKQGGKIVRRSIEVTAMRGVQFTALDYAIALADETQMKLGLKLGWTWYPL
jgi:hypothetical protein